MCADIPEHRKMPRDDPEPLQLLQEITDGFLDRSLQPSEMRGIRNAVTQHIYPIAEHENKILILGSYSEEEKRRLNTVKAALEELYRHDDRDSAYPFLLDDIPGTDIWVKTGIKFRLLGKITDHIVGVPETDSGGFVFEQGILSSEPDLQKKTALLKRQYPTTAEEHENFSLMQADSGIFTNSKHRGDFYRWENDSDLIRCCFELYEQSLS